MPSLTDWQERFRRGECLVPEADIINPQGGEHLLKVFKSFTVPDIKKDSPIAKAAGGNLMKHLGAQWFFNIVYIIGGTFDPKTETRSINKVFVLVPKKNSKSTNSALLMNSLLITNHRENDQIVLIAPTKQVAAISFQMCAASFRAQPDRFPPHLIRIQDGPKVITDRRNGRNNRLVVRAADTSSVVGGKQSITLIDEVHEFGKKAKANAIFSQLQGARASKLDALTFMISTMPDSQPMGVMLNELREGRRVRDAEASEQEIAQYLPVFYELPDRQKQQQAWRQKQIWQKVNPNWGKSVLPKFMEPAYQTALESGPQKLAQFLSKHLNVEIDVRIEQNGWAGAQYWVQAQNQELNLDTLIERSALLTIGVDAGGLDDFMSIAVIGRQASTNKWLHWGCSWVHDKIFEKRPQMKGICQAFIDQGSLVIVPQKNPDLGRNSLCEIMRKVDKTGKLPNRQSVGLDPVGDDLLPDFIFRDGVNKAKVVGIRPGGYLHGTIHTVEHRLHGGLFEHCGTRMMNWCAGNARMKRSGPTVFIDKQLSAPVGKIDPLMALMHGCNRMTACADKHGQANTTQIFDWS